MKIVSGLVSVLFAIVLIGGVAVMVSPSLQENVRSGFQPKTEFGDWKSVTTEEERATLMLATGMLAALDMATPDSSRKKDELKALKNGKIWQGKDFTYQMAFTKNGEAVAVRNTKGVK